MNTWEFGTGMMGYVFGQNALRRTTLGIGKGMNAIGRGLGYVGNSISNTRAGIAMQTAGAKFGQILKPLTSKMSISPAKNL